MFLGMQNDLIAFVSETKEEIENLDYIHFTEIVETTDDYAFENGKYVKRDEDYFKNKITKAKNEKFAENIQKAKQAIENGFVIFKNAEFETNAQTVGDLTATMLMLQAQSNQSEDFEENDNSLSYFWLSRDDKIIELSVGDFVTLGQLIANYKNVVWNEKYLHFKNLIGQAETLDDIDEIEIIY